MESMKSMMGPLLILTILVLGSFFFAWQGVSMQRQVVGQEAQFHALQDEYYTISKTERDAAPTGSALNAQLVEIKNFPSELARLKLVGVGNILTGIFGILLGILMVLFMMPIRLGKMMKN